MVVAARGSRRSSEADLCSFYKAFYERPPFPLGSAKSRSAQITALPASLPSPRGLDFLRCAYSNFFMRVQIGQLEFIQ
jgi:hypothetical protein